jgi:hypothetical protein
VKYDQSLQPSQATPPLPNSRDFLDVEFPANEAIMEVMTLPNEPWNDMHHHALFLPDLE